MWAYAASRVLDYLIAERADLDCEHVSVIGHSRLGKTALWCAAQDERFLLTHNVKAIIAACGTVSSVASDLASDLPVPYFEVVSHAAKAAVMATKNKKIGVIGTAGTVRSGAYEKLILEKDSEMQVFTKACPLFVPLAEEGWTDNEVSKQAAKRYLDELVEKGIDSLVLGCTHYPLLKRCIGTTVGDDIKLVDPAKATAIRVMNFLGERNQLNQEEAEGKKQFYLSDSTDMFQFVCEKALKFPYKPEIIDIERY
jgi:glutamate racemase